MVEVLNAPEHNRKLCLAIGLSTDKNYRLAFIFYHLLYIYFNIYCIYHLLYMWDKIQPPL